VIAIIIAIIRLFLIYRLTSSLPLFKTFKTLLTPGLKVRGLPSFVVIAVIYKIEITHSIRFFIINTVTYGNLRV